MICPRIRTAYQPAHEPQSWTQADNDVADYLHSTAYCPFTYAASVPEGVPGVPRGPVVGCTWRGEGDGLRLRDAGGEG